MALNFQLTVFSDPQGEAAARVYVVAVPDRDATADELAGYRLSGQIIGPTCRYSSTLQTKIPFQHRGLTPCGNRTALLAEALVTDPCYWSTELPFLYRAVGQITGTDAGPTPFEQTFGIRSLGTLRNRFTFNGKTWVPRCVSRDKVVGATLSEWRDAATMMFVENPDDALCREASEIGVLLMTNLDADKANATESLVRVSRYPAVSLVPLELEQTATPEMQTAGRNILLGQSTAYPGMSVGENAFRFSLMPVFPEGLWQGSPAADGMERELAATMARFSRTGLPLVAMRQMDGLRSLHEHRAECDQFQSELARRQIDVAGYMIV
jgi:hypothetical protein